MLSHDEVLGGHVVPETSWGVLAEVDLGAGNKPCLLDEAVASLPTTPLIIEVKNQPNSPGFEPDHRLGLEAADRARPGDVVTSFNWSVVDEVRRVFPDVATGLIVGLLGDAGEAMSHAKENGHGFLVSHIGLATAWAGVHGPLSAEEAVYVWAGTEEDLAAHRGDELRSIGVSGIITDDPSQTRLRLEGES